MGGGGGGVSATTIGVAAGAAAAGGTLVAINETGRNETTTGTTGGATTGTTYAGPFSGPEALSFNGGFCRTEALTGNLGIRLESAAGDSVTGEADIRGTILITATSPGCSDFLNTTDTFGMNKAPVTGTSGSMSFGKAESNTFPPDPVRGFPGGVNTHEFTFSGALNAGTVTGTLFHRRIVNGALVGQSTYAVTLR